MWPFKNKLLNESHQQKTKDSKEITKKQNKNGDKSLLKFCQREGVICKIFNRHKSCDLRRNKRF